MLYGFFRYWVQAWAHIKYKFVVHGRENIPDMKGGYIIACNHQSNFDPPLVAAAFHGRFSFIAKSELFKNKLAGWLIRRCGAFPVERGAGDGVAIQKSIEVIQKKRIFVIFPEGTRAKDGVIGRGKSGVAVIAAKADAPVVPVCITYSGKRRCDIAIGKVIPSDELVIDDNDRRSVRRVSVRIMDAIKALQKQTCGELGIPVPVKAEKADKSDNTDENGADS